MAAKIGVYLYTSILVFSLLLNFYFFVLVRASLQSSTAENVYQKGDRGERIVIVPIEGFIDESMADFVRDAMQALREDEPKAIVLRVESGGGGVGASDRIWHELGRFKQETGIPVVASFGSIAASGGYYVAAPADHILSEPTTITGSIGVMAQLFTVEQLLDKIGVSPVTMAATESTEKLVANDITRPWDEKDRKLVQKILDHARSRFVEIVFDGRQSKMTQEQVDEAASGTIYTTAEAIEMKLVDEGGYLNDAIAKAKSLASIGSSIDPHVTRIEPVGGLNLLGMFMHRRGIDTGPTNINAQQVRRWLGELTTPHVEYRFAPKGITSP